MRDEGEERRGKKQLQHDYTRATLSNSNSSRSFRSFLVVVASTVSRPSYPKENNERNTSSHIITFCYSFSHFLSSTVARPVD